MLATKAKMKISWMGILFSAILGLALAPRGMAQSFALIGPVAESVSAAVGAGPSTQVTPNLVAMAPTPAASYTIPSKHPRILLNDPATKNRLKEALDGRSLLAMRFQSEVSLQLFGKKAYLFQPWYAALMYQMSGDVRYATYAIEETDRWVTAEEEKIARGQRPEVAADSYLDIGMSIGNVALVYDWCHERITTKQRERWLAYSNQAVWNVWNPHRARWGNTSHPWTGWSVDNPSNNYYYSFLRATMLLGLATHGEAPLADQWIQQFRSVKIEQQLVPLFTRELQGGGSREGTGYGTAMKNLFQLYDWWQQSTGEAIAQRTPHTLASMAHLIHSIVPTLDRLTPTGDHARDSGAALFDYHREYLMVLMALFPEQPLSGIARTLLEKSSVPRMRHSFMYYVDFLYNRPELQARPLTDLSTAYWGSGTGQLMTRSSWDANATYANFICGPYTESHAHRDQGSFVIFKGTWLAGDSNVFSHSGLEQDEEMHNLVRFESSGSTIKQQIGTQCTLAALADTPLYTYAAARITPVHRGQSAVVQSERDFLFIKPDTFIVFDRAVAKDSSTRRVWTLNLGGSPTIQGDSIRFAAGKSRMDVIRVAPSELIASAFSWKSMRSGMAGGVRVDVPDSNGKSSLFLHVFSINGSVATVAAMDGPNQLGVRVNLADGRQVVVLFSTKSSGGQLELLGSDHGVQARGPLPDTVASLPLFVK